MSITQKDMYEMFAEIYYKRVFRPYADNEIHVTEATQCLLKSFYQRKMRRALLEPKVVVLSFGTLVHEALHEPLRRRGYQCELEGKYEIGDVTLYAHGDAVADNHGLELKTITRMPTDALSHHKLQSNAYSYIFDKPEWYVSYIHKPSGLCKVFNVPKNDDMFKYVVMRAVRLATLLPKNIAPKPEPSWLCAYCEYVDICPRAYRHIRKRWL